MPPRPSLVAHLSALAIVATLALGLFYPVFDIRPFDDDNVYALGWVSSAPLTSIVAGDPTYYPEWRPLAYLTLWLEGRLLGDRPATAHFAVNLALWIACAWLVYLIVMRLSDSWKAAVLASIIILIDPRITWTLVSTVERQTSLACLFGLSAILMAIGGERRLSLARAAVIFVLFLLSALGKEYGLAFALAMAAAGAWRRRFDVALPAAGAIVIYLALRLALSSGASEPYCEDMYFFSTLRVQCLDPWRLVGVPQMIYNVAATLVNLPLQGLMSGEGRPHIAEYRLAAAATFLILAIIGVRKGPLPTRMIALVPVANALLSFMIYRDRNELAGACALAILAGVGVALGPAVRAPRLARLAMIAALAVVLVTNSALANVQVREARAAANAIDPCLSELRHRAVVQAFITREKARYGMFDPSCTRRPAR